MGRKIYQINLNQIMQTILLYPLIYSLQSWRQSQEKRYKKKLEFLCLVRPNEVRHWNWLYVQWERGGGSLPSNKRIRRPEAAQTAYYCAHEHRTVDDGLPYIVYVYIYKLYICGHNDVFISYIHIYNIYTYQRIFLQCSRMCDWVGYASARAICGLCYHATNAMALSTT